VSSTESAPRAFGESGRRDTRQRRLLREHLAESEAFVSAQQLHDEVRATGDKVGLATVYRTLQAMTEAGEVDVIRSDEGEALYRNCGLTVEVDGPAVESWARDAAEEHGFTEVTHVVELFGRCSSCSQH
jgi:Fur family transcriptional regulator, ferric uptake regulator